MKLVAGKGLYVPTSDLWKRQIPMPHGTWTRSRSISSQLPHRTARIATMLPSGSAASLPSTSTLTHRATVHVSAPFLQMYLHTFVSACAWVFFPFSVSFLFLFFFSFSFLPFFFSFLFLLTFLFSQHSDNSAPWHRGIAHEFCQAAL